MGIEPTLSAWEAEVLPLNYTRDDYILIHMTIITVTVTVNGAARQMPADASVQTLVEALGLTGRRVAIERNGTIVSRSQWTEVTLLPDDRLEVVGAVGGG